MRTAHTPGPWKFTGQTSQQVRLEAADGTDGGGACGSISAKDPKNRYGQTVVFLPHNRDARKDNEWLANAHLIAAAPVMLEALEAASEWLNDMGCEHAESEPDMQCTVCIVNRAIAQAKGRAA